MKKKFIVQQKGGTGKSVYARLLSLYYSFKSDLPVVFYDMDKATPTIAPFLLGLGDRKPKNIKLLDMDIMGLDQKIDRTKFDYFIDTISQIKTDVIVDFGAASSEQLYFYLAENKDFIAILKDMGVEIHLVVPSGNMYAECEKVYKQFHSLELGDMLKIVANDYLGAFPANPYFGTPSITISALHIDKDSEAQKSFNNLLDKGVSYQHIEAMPVLQRSRIVSYLNTFFNQVN